MKLLAMVLLFIMATPAYAQNDGWLASNRPAHFAVGVGIGQALTAAGRGNNWLIQGKLEWYQRLLLSTAGALAAGYLYEIAAPGKFDNKDAIVTGVGGVAGSLLQISFDF